MSPPDIAVAVLAVLAGNPTSTVAAHFGIREADLLDAQETYQQAGSTALAGQAAQRDWYQAHIEWPDWAAAEATAVAHLAPRLRQLQDTGTITTWWYIRKAPCWRVRVKPHPDIADAHIAIAVGEILDQLAEDSLVSRWRRTIYEPEIFAFGGQHAMAIAHDLFAADSDHILTYLAQSTPGLGRRELAILFCTTMFRAAGQEWFECGAVWDHVTAMRPLPDDVPAEKITMLAHKIRTLIAADTRPDGALFGAGGPLASLAPWAGAFTRAGRALAAAALDGALQQGIRDVLRYQLIFHCNRFGLDARTQAIVASAAKTAIARG